MQKNKKNKDTIVFDLETTELIKKNIAKKSSQRFIKKLKIAVVCAYSYSKNKYIFFTEKNIKKLFKMFEKACKIIGYNIIDFDYEVLKKYGLPKNIFAASKQLYQRGRLLKEYTKKKEGIYIEKGCGYGTFKLSGKKMIEIEIEKDYPYYYNKNKTIDLFDIIRKETGNWYSLDKSSKENLGRGKLYKGKELPSMSKKKLYAGCKADVQNTKELYDLWKINKLKYDKIYRHKGMKIGTLCHFDWCPSVFWIISKSEAGVLYTLFPKRYPKRKEILRKRYGTDKKVILRLLGKSGRGFVDVVMIDGIFDDFSLLNTIKFFKNIAGWKIMGVTRSKKLEPVKRINSFLKKGGWKEWIRKYEWNYSGIPISRVKKIYEMDWEWNDEKIRIVKIVEKEYEKKLIEKKEYYIITNEIKLNGKDMARLVWMREKNISILERWKIYRGWKMYIGNDSEVLFAYP